MTKKRQQLAFTVNLISFFLLIYLTWKYYALHFLTGDSKSICSINTLFDCTSVSASRYSSLWGIPISLWGAGSLLALLGLISVNLLGLSKDIESNLKAQWLVSLFITLVDIGMATISITQMNTYCLFCISAYLLSFLSTWLLWPPQQVKKIHLSSLFCKQHIIWFGVCLIGVWFTHNLVTSSVAGELDKVVQGSLQDWRNLPSAAQPIFIEQALVRGASAENVMMDIVEFADLLCPHCRQAAPALKAFTSSHPKVRLSFAHFPLDGNCNPALEKGRSSGSCLLAKYITCGEQQKKIGWDIQEWLYENQGLIKPDDLSKVVTQFHLDEITFKECVQSLTTDTLIRNQAQIGKTLGVEGTPSVFVNGKLLHGGFILGVLQAVYDDLENGTKK